MSVLEGCERCVRGVVVLEACDRGGMSMRHVRYTFSLRALSMALRFSLLASFSCFGVSCLGRFRLLSANLFFAIAALLRVCAATEGCSRFKVQGSRFRVRVCVGWCGMVSKGVRGCTEGGKAVGEYVYAPAPSPCARAGSSFPFPT